MIKKFAIITDAHANLPALDTVLREIMDEECDAIFHTGDAMGFGPYPAEVVDRLLSTPNVRLIMGNHDEWFAFGLPEPRPAWMSPGELSHHQWVHAQLDPLLREVIADWPYTISENVFGLRLTFTHYGRDEGGLGFRPVIADPTPSALDHLFASREANLIFYGHHHRPSDIQGRARYVNMGTLGCCSRPIARYGILNIAEDGTYRLLKRAAPYDQTDLFRQFVDRDVPEREFVCRVILGHPPEMQLG